MWNSEYLQILSNISEGYISINITCSKFGSDYFLAIKDVNDNFKKITHVDSQQLVGRDLMCSLGIEEREVYNSVIQAHSKSITTEAEAYSSVAKKTLQFKFFPTIPAHVGCVLTEPSTVADKSPTLSRYPTVEWNKFSSILNHEIRTPLNGMMGMLELLNETELDGYQHSILRIGNNSVERLTSFIEQINDLKRYIDPDTQQIQ